MLSNILLYTGQYFVALVWTTRSATKREMAPFLDALKRVHGRTAICCKCRQSGTFFSNGSAQASHLLTTTSGSDMVVDHPFKLIIGDQWRSKVESPGFWGIFERNGGLRSSLHFYKQTYILNGRKRLSYFPKVKNVFSLKVLDIKTRLINRVRNLARIQESILPKILLNKVERIQVDSRNIC